MNINGARWRRPGSDGRREGVGRSPLTGGAPTIAHATAHARARRSAPPGVLNGNGHRVDRNDAHLNARGSDVEGPLGSIVIPARNEATVVGRTLADVFMAWTRPLEVVVACNGCTDTTVQVANEVGAPVTVLDLPVVGKAGAIRPRSSPPAPCHACTSTQMSDSRAFGGRRPRRPSRRAPLRHVPRCGTRRRVPHAS